MARTKNGPGRPKKPISSPAAATPPAPPTTPAAATPAALLAEVAPAIRAKMGRGGSLAHHEAKILREAVWLEKHLDYWPGIDAAAADLGVSANTLRSWADEGCPGIEAHLPVHRASVLAWLLARANERGANPHATKDTIEDWDARLRRAKAIEREGLLVAEADDRARQALLATCGDLRTALLDHAPRTVAEALPFATAADCEDAVRTAITTAIASAVAPTTQETA